MSKHKKRQKPHHVVTPEDRAAEAHESDMEDSGDDLNTEAQNEGVHAEGHSPDIEVEIETEHGFESDSRFDSDSEERPKTHLEFVGSELIRQKAPKVMEVADTVVDEWMKDGQFEGLPVGNPLAQFAAAKVLRKAKDVEKKLEEKGVFMMARMGLDYAKSKLNKR